MLDAGFRFSRQYFCLVVGYHQRLLDAPVAMGYVSTFCAKPGTPLNAEVRGKRLPVAVAGLPFVTPHYNRR
jgi:glycine cleavage system aminomethyltransferase T